MSDQSHQPKTTEEKIRMCISYLQKHGYQVIFPKFGKESAHVAKLVNSQREQMLMLGGASAASLLDARNVSAITGIGEESLTYYIKTHGFPEPVIGGRGAKTTRRWRLCDVQAFVQAKTTYPG